MSSISSRSGMAFALARCRYRIQCLPFQPTGATSPLYTIETKVISPCLKVDYNGLLLLVHSYRGILHPQFTMASSSALAHLTLLVVSNDYSVLKLFAGAWRDAGTRIESTANIPRAMDMVKQRRMQAVVVDMKLHGACDLIRLARIECGKGGPLILACADNIEEERASLNAGAHFAAQRAGSAEKVFDLLTRSGMELPQRRLSVRYNVVAPVTIFSAGSQYRALISNLSAGGMAIRSARAAGTNGEIDFFFELHATAVSGRGRVIWHNENGCAGIQFDSIRCSNALLFAAWLNKQGFLLGC
jgi:PilZ domain